MKENFVAKKKKPILFKSERTPLALLDSPVTEHTPMRKENKNA